MKKPKEVTRTYELPGLREPRGDPGSGGQSGDTQGLPDQAEAGSESVKELLEEGQSFEAEVIMGVEDAPDADVSEVRTKAIAEDGVPSPDVERGLKIAARNP